MNINFTTINSVLGTIALFAGIFGLLLGKKDSETRDNISNMFLMAIAFFLLAIAQK